MKFRCLLSVLIFVLPLAATAAIKTDTVSYKDGNTELQGIIVYDDGIEGVRPGIIVIHEWWGLNDYVRKRAEMLASLGYVAFAIDMYGKGKVTEHGNQAGEWMKQITTNVANWQDRALLGLDILKNHKLVASSHVAAIGYCFGGATVMQMAYTGADLKGVASFHGSLPTPVADQAKSIKADSFVAHGNADAFVPPERVAKFKQAMKRSGVNLQFLGFPGVRHGFTNPQAGKYGIDNLAYEPEADKISWERLIDFFEQVFYRKGQR